MNLEAQVFIGQDNEVVIAFDKILPVQLSGVEVQEDTGLLNLMFHDRDDKEKQGEALLNCPLCYETMQKVLDKSHCAAGFFQDSIMEEACYLPLYHSKSEYKKGQEIQS